MAAVSWKSAVAGNWTTAADWSTGAVPGAADAVTIGVSGYYTVTLTTLVTVGSIAVSDAGATLAISDPSKTESIAGDLSNSGTVEVDASGNGGTAVDIAGTLTNSGTLSLGNKSGSGSALSETVVTAAGLVNTGTIVLEGPFSTVLDITAAAPTTLTGTVELHGNSRLEFASGGITAIASGATLLEDSGAAVVALASNTGANSALAGLASNAGSTIFENGAALTIAGNFDNRNLLEVDESGDGGSSLTVGKTLTNNGQLYIGNSGLIADATVTAGAVSNSAGIYLTSGTARAALAVTEAFGNTGTIIDGDGGGAGSSVTVGGTLTNGGALYLQNGATLSATTGLTNSDYLEVDASGSGGSSLTVGGTLTNKSGYFSIGDSGITAATTVRAAGLSNSGGLYLDSGTAAATLHVTGDFDNIGTVEVDYYSGTGGSSLTAGGTLTNHGDLYIGYAGLTKATTVTAGELANTGTIDLTGGASKPATLDITTAAPATLTGNFNLVGDAVLEFAKGGISAIGSGAELSLNGAKALVALSSALTTDSALSGLAGNAGTLVLENGAALTTAVGLDNIGIISVDSYYSGGSSLTVGGTLTNEDVLYIGYYGNNTAPTTVSAAALTNFGVVELYSAKAMATLKVAGVFGNGRNDTVYVDNGGAGGSRLTIGATLTNNGALDIGNSSLTKATIVTAAGLVGTGTVNLMGSTTAAATLGITGAASATLDGTYSLAGDALLEFASGGVTAIGNGAGLTLSGARALVARSSGLTTNSALTGLAANAGNLVLENGAALDTTVGLDNTDVIYVDSYYGNGAGGSSLTIGGTLTNENGLYIGYYGNNTAATTVSAAALNNFGNLQLYSNKATATLKIAGAFSNGLNDTVDVDTSGSGGSSLTIGGALTNSSYYFAVGNSSLTKATTVTAASFANTGTIDLTGGANAAASLDVTGPAPATLNGSYTLSGDARLEFGSGAATGIGIGSGLTLNGPKALVALNSGLTTNSALTRLADNAGTLVLENGAVLTTTVGLTSTGPVYVNSYYSSGGGSSLTIGGMLTNEDDFYIGYYGNNTAATTVSSAALNNFGFLDLYSSAKAAATLKVAGAFGNGRNDTAEVDYGGTGGSTLTIGGRLTNNGALDIGYTSLTKATTVTAAGLANTGTINLTGSTTAPATLDITGAAPTTLDGSYSLSGDARLEFGSGEVAVIGSGASLTLNGAKALVALSGALTTDSALTGLADNAGTLVLENIPALTTTVGLDNTGDLYVDFYYGGGGGSSLTIGGMLTNENYLEIGNTGLTAATTVSAPALNNFGIAELYSGKAGATLKVAGAFGNGRNDTVYADNDGTGGSSLTVGGILTNNGSFYVGNTAETKATTVTAAGLVNTGLIYLTGGPNAAAALDVTGAAPATLNGDFYLAANALLEFGSGGVTGIGNSASLTLDGKAVVALSSAPTTDSALTRLASNAGTLALYDAPALTTTTGFTNSGTARVDDGLGGGSSLTIGGTLTNSVSADFYIGNSGITAATKVSAAALDNSGYISLAGGSGTHTGTLSLAGASSDAGTIYVDGGGVLALGGTLTVTGSLYLYGGTISGGALAGAGTIESFSSLPGTLANVTIAAGASVSAAAGTTLFDNGVTVNGALHGNGGATLDFAKTGSDSLTNVSGFTTIGLANGAANTLTLAAANFTGAGGVITVDDGNSGNTVGGSRLTSADAIVVHAGGGADVLTGGAGNDVFYAGGATTMTGGKGTNQFVFDAPGASNKIADFQASPTNELVFSNSGFNLGLGGATSTPQALPASEAATLFTANPTGAFANTSQRLAYDTANGELFSSTAGSGSAAHLVATLTNHPHIAAGQLFFIG